MHIAGALEINSANEAELDSVRGFGPETTARILRARDAGPFADWADLMRRVKGIKMASARKLSSGGLTINGLPYSPGESVPAGGSPTEKKSGAP